MLLRLLIRRARVNADSSGAIQDDDRCALRKWEQTVRENALRAPRLIRSCSEGYRDLLFLFVDSSDLAGAAVLTSAFGNRIAARGYLHQSSSVRRSAPKFELDSLAVSLVWAAQWLAEGLDHSPVTSLVVFTDNSANVGRLRRQTPLAASSSVNLVVIRRLLIIKNCLYHLEKAGISTMVAHISGSWNIADAASRGKVHSDISEELFPLLRQFYDDASALTPTQLSLIPSVFRLPADYSLSQPPTSVTKNISATPIDSAVSYPTCLTTVEASISHGQTVCRVDPTSFSESVMVPTTLYGYRLLVAALKGWQSLSLNLAGREIPSGDDETPTPLRLTVRDAQRHYGVSKLLRHPFSTMDSADTVIYRCRQDVDGHVYDQAVVPPTMALLQSTVAKSFHNEAHGGVNATYRDLVRRYHWPGMRAQVSRMVKSCGVCIKNKPRAHALQASGIIPAERKPWRSVGIDHCGPYEGNGDRSKFLVVATCLLTGYIEAEVVGSTNAINLITACRRIFARAGVPRRVCSDRGPAFVSSPFRLFLSKRNVLHHLIPASSPQYGGKWERSHGPLNQKIRVLLATQVKRDWRTLVSEAVSLSNARLRWDSISSWDLLHSYDFDQTKPSSCHASNLLESWIERHWEDDREKSRRRLGDRSSTIGIGDRVYLSTPSPGKLDALARGPYVVGRISGDVYTLRESSTGKVICQPLRNLIPTTCIAP
ncbi:retrovirus polyprotein, putative [Perkinsus marinus ATCC 50983]|uniref:Retrovirus polyprotein, putative n=1 Tax=Perkinsus marinus (strain ATCC 50983 / TXsc) TaxID=423536 RepID=C5KA92_PERM5|nr:retrovirus polyprotein, putative [Perkinsus marinus ATCC 50983]EER18553.1 retrovirus polyprotein, putative [Perkinsus marinus ATCC 50983]|eukprot:XP_002786757.1 retrovirus polyprotein, putative [Perkinsus marinus ATCC 50983]